MTREEMDFIGSMNMCDEISNEAYQKIMIHCEEQEPCDDCISREEAIRMFADDDYTVNELRNLPSATPQPKSGRWIDAETLDSALWHACSECGETEFYATNFCPNCGAKMEVEE